MSIEKQRVIRANNLWLFVAGWLISSL